MTDRLRDWIALLDELYPQQDAEGWDSVGLQVGDPDGVVSAGIVCLDVTEGVLDEAVEKGAEFVIAHHPLLLRPLARLAPDTAAGTLALDAARRGLSVVAAHTNVDVAAGGTSDPTVALLGLKDVEPLRRTEREGQASAKLVTFVPREYTAAVLDALAGAGAGVIGEYDHCSFRLEGTGTFRPSGSANPAVGEREALNEVAEHRLEIVVGRSRLAGAVAALQQAHPYEEVAYDVYPLLDTGTQGPYKGLGRIGDLTEPRTLREVADHLAGGLPAPHLRVAGDLERQLRRVAVCGGAGDSLIEEARRAGADAYVTGDLRHHPTLDALTMGLALVDAGHYATEAAALPGVCAQLRERAAEHGLSARLLASAVCTEPWSEYRPPRREEGAL